MVLREFGIMTKAIYDIGANGIVDNAEKLEGSTKAEVQNHTPQSHEHVETDITDLDHDADKIKGKVVDESGIGDSKVLAYNQSEDKIEYQTAGGGGGGDMYKADYDGNDDNVVNDSDKLEGSTKSEVQNHNPNSHTHLEVDVTDLEHYDNNDLKSEHPSLTGADLHEPKTHTHIEDDITDLHGIPTQETITDGTTFKKFLNTERTKLTGIDDNANNYSHPSSGECPQTPSNHNHIETDITDLDHYDTAEFNTDHSGLSGECPQTPKSHTHLEVDITDLDHDADKIKGVTVDDTDKANGKILKYNATSGNLEYETDLTGGGNGGANVKSGFATVPGKNWTVIPFNTSFASTPHVAGALDLNASWSIRNVTVNSFEVYINSAGAGKGFWWIATDAGNP